MTRAIVTQVSSNWKALQARLKGQGETQEKKADELWFEVDEKDLARSKNESCKPVSLISLFPHSSSSSTNNRYVAMDCEFVGVGPDGRDSALARLSLVNWHGNVLLDIYVRPSEKVTDFRTSVSGILPRHMSSAITHSQALESLNAIIKKDTILIGHGLKNDMRVLMLFSHPRKQTRDTSKYRPFRAMAKGKTPALKRLAKEVLGIEIQEREHDSVEDARAAMLLYQLHKDNWENYLFRQEGKTVKAAKRARKALLNENKADV